MKDAKAAGMEQDEAVNGSIDVQSSVAVRSADGRFLTGNSGGGRPKGSRNKLTESVLAIVALDFEQHGEAVLSKLREQDPATYLRFIAAILPKELIAEREKSPLPYLGELSLDELGEIIENARRKHFAMAAVQSLAG